MINVDEARRTYGALVDRYAHFQFQQDPLADEAVAALAGIQDGHAMVLRALERGVDAVPDAPDALRAFMAQVERVPRWADFGQMDLGARTYQRTGAAAMMILSAWSLMNGYHCGPAVKPLAFTAQLEKMAPRRLAETSRFVTEVAQVGGLRRRGAGFEIAVRVRLMHAMVRRGLLASGRWDTPAWGAPINQSDMLGTIFQFSLLVLRGADMMGFHFSPAEREAVVHLWRYCGYLSGVDGELLAELDSESRGTRFAEMMRLVQVGPDEDSLALAAALRKVPAQMASTPVEKLMSQLIIKYHDGLTWAFNGDDIAGDLRIPNRRWRYALYPTRAVVSSLELVRRAVPGMTRLATTVGNRRVRGGVRKILAGHEPSFA